VVFEEAALLGEGPGAEDTPHGVGGRRGDVAGRVDRGGEDVAAAAPADQDLAATVPGSLEEEDGAPGAGGLGARGEDRGHETGSAGADDDDRECGFSSWHRLIEWWISVGRSH